MLYAWSPDTNQLMRGVGGEGGGLGQKLTLCQRQVIVNYWMIYHIVYWAKSDYCNLFIDCIELNVLLILKELNNLVWFYNIGQS